jgi:hypothetical protein
MIHPPRRSSFLLVLLAAGACGSEEAVPADEDGGVAAVAEGTGGAAPAEIDPCSLIPVSEWIARTGYEDIEVDRSARDTCDYLSDEMFGVVGSVVLPIRALLDNPPGIAGEPERLSGLGDEAILIRGGPVVRKGDRVLWVTVHPSVPNQREVSLELARIALERF